MTQKDYEKELVDWLRCEKAIRDVVLKQLQTSTEKSRGKKIREWLNEPITLWFLSSVILGLITWGYTQWEDNRAQQERNAISITKLDIEISSRVQKAVDRLNSAKDNVGVKDSIKILDRGSGVFGAFKDRPLESLLFELSWFVTSDEKSKIELARKAYSSLPEIQQQSSEDFNLGRSKLAEKYNNYFVIRNWQTHQ